MKRGLVSAPDPENDMNPLRLSSRTRIPRGGESRPNPALQRAMRFLGKHWSRLISTDDLAAAARLSRRGLHKTFVKHLGHGPGRELRRIRIQHARRILVQTPRSLKSVAGMCGFRNPNTFFVAFKRETGASPGRYRSMFGRPAFQIVHSVRRSSRLAATRPRKQSAPSVKAGGSRRLTILSCS